MELCHSVRKCFENLGIVPIQSNQNSSFNSKNLFVLMCLLQMFLSSLAYLLFEAKSIGKLADSFYMILTSLACAIFFSICIWKIANILQLIREFEQFIGKSKFKISNPRCAVCAIALNYLFKFAFRIDRHNFKSDVHRADWENRTIISHSLHWCYQTYHSRNYYSGTFNYTHQFFRLPFRRWFILFTVSSDVSFDNVNDKSERKNTSQHC